MVSLQPITTESEFDDNRPWLVNADRSQNRSVTLDVAKFRAVSGLVVGGFIVAGVEVALDENGLGVPAATTAPADGEANYGILFTREHVGADVTKAAVPVMRAGTVRSADAPRAFVALPATILEA